jgi:hypothetical protein
MPVAVSAAFDLITGGRSNTYLNEISTYDQGKTNTNCFGLRSLGSTMIRRSLHPLPDHPVTKWRIIAGLSSECPRCGVFGDRQSDGQGCLLYSQCFLGIEKKRGQAGQKGPPLPSPCSPSLVWCSRTSSPESKCRAHSIHHVCDVEMASC